MSGKHARWKAYLEQADGSREPLDGARLIVDLEGGAELIVQLDHFVWQFGPQGPVRIEAGPRVTRENYEEGREYHHLHIVPAASNSCAVFVGRSEDYKPR